MYNILMLISIIEIPAIPIGLAGILIGGLITSFFIQANLKKKSKNILREAKAEAEMLKKDKILQAKEKFLQLKAEHERTINDRNSKMSQKTLG